MLRTHSDGLKVDITCSNLHKEGPYQLKLPGNDLETLPASKEVPKILSFTKDIIHRKKVQMSMTTLILRQTSSSAQQAAQRPAHRLTPKRELQPHSSQYFDKIPCELDVRMYRGDVLFDVEV